MDLDVGVKKIDEVVAHPNADRLDLARIGGYFVVVQKGVFKEGERIVYLPENSLLPPWLISRLGLEGRLSGKDKNRVKAVRLRGSLSQGLVVPLEDNCTRIRGEDGSEHLVDRFFEKDSLANFLGVTKYVAPIPVEMQGAIEMCPIHLPHYDVDDWKRDPDTIADGQDMIAQEKLHGTLVVIAWRRGKPHHGDIGPWIASKGVAKKNMCFQRGEATEGNLYMRTAGPQAKSLRDAAFHEVMISSAPMGSPYAIAWIGEIIGPKVQDLHYGLKEPTLYVFELMAKWTYESEWCGMSTEEMTAAASRAGVPVVPIVGEVSAEPPITHQVIRRVQDFAEGESLLPSAKGQIREGIVMRHPDGHVRKAVSEKYLTRKGGTERN